MAPVNSQTSLFECVLKVAKIVFMGKVLKLKLKCVWKSYYNIVLQKVIITYKISKFSKKFPIILTENRK